MKEFEIPPFYVGQEVVANCNHPFGFFKKGQEFKVTSIKKACCYYLVTVGILHCGRTRRCIVCNNSEQVITNELLIAHMRFSPKIEVSDFISMKQLAETQLETIGAN